MAKDTNQPPGLWRALKERKRYWLLPAALLLLLLVCLVMAASGPALSPFIYAVF